MLRYASFTLLAWFLLTAETCDHKSTATEIEAGQQELTTLQAVRSVGVPAIVNFQEKRMLKQVLELRDTALSTTTYIVDLYGKLHKVCDSVGYGIPYATQYTNPQRRGGYSEHPYVLPQADPNGLYSPPTADGTWVQCLDPATKEMKVVYLEPRVVVSPFPLDVK